MRHLSVFSLQPLMSFRSLKFQNNCVMLFGTLHLIFLVASILPRKWALSIGIGSFTQAYESVTTCLQDWSMFYTIPTIHYLDVRIMVAAPGSPARPVGMRIPGLRPFPLPEQARYSNWVSLVLLRNTRSDQREPYMKRVAAELLKTGIYPPESKVWLDCDVWYTRSLLGVRKLREIAVKKTTTMGPFIIRDLAPTAAPRA